MVDWTLVGWAVIVSGAIAVALIGWRRGRQVSDEATTTQDLAVRLDVVDELESIRAALERARSEADGRGNKTAAAAIVHALQPVTEFEQEARLAPVGRGVDAARAGALLKHDSNVRGGLSAALDAARILRSDATAGTPDLEQGITILRDHLSDALLHFRQRNQLLRGGAA